MSGLADFHFIRPGWLLLLPVVVVIWWLRLRGNDVLQGWRRSIDPELLAALVIQGNGDRSARIAPQTLLLIGWLLAVIAVAGPTWRPEPSPFADDPVPVMVLLKASQSTDSEDLMPSRIERARLKVIDLAEMRKGQPLGLIAYSGTSHLVLPPTRDTSVVAAMASEISSVIMPREGDDLSGAIGLASQTLGDAAGSIVIVADDAIVDDRLLGELRAVTRQDLTLLAVARESTPEYDSLRQAASSLGATLTPITPDSTDVDQLIRRIARTPRTIAGESPRWAESGWWLVPILAAIIAVSFRRQTHAGEVQIDNPSLET